MLKPEGKIALWLVLLSMGCSREPAPPAPAPVTPSAVPIATAAASTPPPAEPAPFRVNVGHGAELYLPPSFAAKNGKYDLIVHFHGEGRWQEENLAHAKLDIAVVSINLGMGTEPYAKAFKSSGALERLLATTQAEIVKSGRGMALGRLALSAWSAGFSSIGAAMNDTTAARVDAILLADGFFTSFTDVKKRTVNDAGLTRFVRFAEQAKKDEKLFAITHSSIPTGPYPSVQECTSRLLELVSVPKTPASGLGPLAMRETYTVDQGSFHVRGFEGLTAGDHVKELHAMGETVYPYLKARWAKQDLSTR